MESLIGCGDCLCSTRRNKIGNIAVLVLQIVEVKSVLYKVLSRVLWMIAASEEAVAAIHHGHEDQ